MCTGMTHGAGVCPTADMVQAFWRDSVTLTAVVRPMAHSPCAAWPSVGLEQTSRLSCAKRLGATEVDLNRYYLLSLFLSFSLLLVTKAVRDTLLLTDTSSHGPGPVPRSSSSPKVPLPF
jgi:hypothetical protein